MHKHQLSFVKFEKVNFKLYKSKKIWVIAGTTVIFGVNGLVGGQAVHAAVTGDATVTQPMAMSEITGDATSVSSVTPTENVESTTTESTPTEHSALTVVATEPAADSVSATKSLASVETSEPVIPIETDTPETTPTDTTAGTPGVTPSQASTTTPVATVTPTSDPTQAPRAVMPVTIDFYDPYTNQNFGSVTGTFGSEELLNKIKLKSAEIVATGYTQVTDLTDWWYTDDLHGTVGHPNNATTNSVLQQVTNTMTFEQAVAGMDELMENVADQYNTSNGTHYVMTRQFGLFSDFLSVRTETHPYEICYFFYDPQVTTESFNDSLKAAEQFSNQMITERIADSDDFVAFSHVLTSQGYDTQVMVGTSTDDLAAFNAGNLIAGKGGHGQLAWDVETDYSVAFHINDQTYTPTAPGPYYGTTLTDLTQNIPYTLTYQAPSPQAGTTTQTLSFYRQLTWNPDTQKYEDKQYNAWTTDSNGDATQGQVSQSIAALTALAAPAGYTGQVTTVLTKTDGTQTTVGNDAVTLTGDDGITMITRTVTYTANPQIITVNYVDEKGQTLAPATSVTGQTDQSVDLTSIHTVIQAVLNQRYNLVQDNTVSLTKFGSTAKTVTVVFRPLVAPQYTRYQVPTEGTPFVLPAEYYNHLVPQTKVPDTAPSVSMTDYYDYSHPQVKTQVPTEAPHLDQSNRLVSNETHGLDNGPQKRTQVPAEAPHLDRSSQLVSNETHGLDNGPQKRTQVPAEAPHPDQSSQLTSNEVHRLDNGPQKRTQVPAEAPHLDQGSQLNEVYDLDNSLQKQAQVPAEASYLNNRLQSHEGPAQTAPVSVKKLNVAQTAKVRL
jgi:hypothetical protein